MWFRCAQLEDQLEDSAHLFELFGPIVSMEHSDSYAWANSLFGLVQAVHSIACVESQSKIPTLMCPFTVKM